MWAIVEFIVLILQILCLFPRNPSSTAKIDEATSRRLERFRWLIYGLILFSIALLACIGIVLLVTP